MTPTAVICLCICALVIGTCLGFLGGSIWCAHWCRLQRLENSEAENG